jgi:thiosulfate/3-mercaptopyruvate sulfurtransferase
MRSMATNGVGPNQRRREPAMLKGKLSVGGVLLSFMAGGLLVGGLVLIEQPSRSPATQAEPAQTKPPPGTSPIPWLKGTTDEKFAQIERHLRGLDVTMAEIGYRYGELLIAGKTWNWEYAQYQAEKIDLSLRLAVERRPKRGKSSEAFLNESLPPVMEAIKAKSGEKLDVALEKLHAGCVQCHKAENVLHFKESVDRIKERAKPLDGPKQPEPRTMLIEPGELQKKLKEPGLRILDTRPQAEYAKGHVPGAVPVDVKGWQDLGKKEGGFHDAKAWREKVGQLGISHDSQVVVYGSNLTDTARIWWTLKYLGLQNVTILNGGWQLWVKEKQPTEAASAKIEAVKFEPKFQADRLEEIDSLKKSVQAGKVTVVDARSTDEFTGKEVRGKRGGHIPGAKHLEWKDVLAEDGRFKSPEQLQELFRQRGITPDQTAVTC